jgi:hypothetical protein
LAESIIEALHDDTRLVQEVGEDLLAQAECDLVHMAARLDVFLSILDTLRGPDARRGATLRATLPALFNFFATVQAGRELAQAAQEERAARPDEGARRA